MPKKTIVNAHGDCTIDYSVDELINLYLKEGKSLYEAKLFAEQLAKAMHANTRRWKRSEFRSMNDE